MFQALVQVLQLCFLYRNGHSRPVHCDVSLIVVTQQSMFTTFSFLCNPLGTVVEILVYNMYHLTTLF